MVYDFLYLVIALPSVIICHILISTKYMSSKDCYQKHTHSHLCLTVEDDESLSLILDERFKQGLIGLSLGLSLVSLLSQESILDEDMILS